MLVVGLTGGIASGKSTVAKMFVEKGYRVLDSDVFARDGYSQARKDGRRSGLLLVMSAFLLTGA